jgi:hypothetical protein
LRKNLKIIAWVKAGHNHSFFGFKPFFFSISFLPFIFDHWAPIAEANNDLTIAKYFREQAKIKGIDRLSY